MLIWLLFDIDADRKRAFELQLEDCKEELQRLGLVGVVREDLAPAWKEKLEANAFNVLACMLNVIGENVSYYATRSSGRFVSKTSNLPSVQVLSS
jgi:hypothetical protein